VDERRLRSLPLFADLGRRELGRVAQVADEVDVREGERLVREGEFAYEVFVIEQGTAEVVRGGDRVAELGPGDFLGEMGAIHHATRNATVVATSPMTVVVITARDFRHLERDIPQVAEHIRAACVERSRALAA
jgi:CRP-like cAMP-binding protein